MKAVLRFCLSVCLFAAVQVRATTIFFDNFEQFFPGGADLTETNYPPSFGVSAGIHTNDNNGENSTTVVASNFMGSVRAFFNKGTLPYQHKYRGDQDGGELTNQSIVLSFKLWIEQTKTPSHIGGFAINVTTTNLDISCDVNGCNTNGLNHNPLIFINDGGQVYAFTNDVSQSSSITPIQIGSWASLAN